MKRSKLPSIVVHGHFYQPPRDDPWLEEIPTQPTAAPFHDWNERIEAECYRAVVAARIVDEQGRIVRIVNTLTSMSFNFGPTLLTWMERHAPNTYAAVIAADGLSRQTLGYGNAIAMPYHHSILPLCTRRDKRTEVRWGIRDFQKRFKRDPDGMWLPETAVDEETLDVLAGEGIAFTILAPHQIKVPHQKGFPGRYRTPSGKTIALFAYDGTISHDLAFGTLLEDAEIFYDRVLERKVPLVTLAADGETFGHHRKFGEMALASVITKIQKRKRVALENFASFLSHHPPDRDVELVAPSSWSCSHGVERWRSDCGCKMRPDVETQQRWRTPLRDALNWLKGELDNIFEERAGELVDDPWASRDEYVNVLSQTTEGTIERLKTCFPSVAPEDLPHLAELLEMERNALRMFTSCGWFFDDIAGIEAVQILRYAARAIDLADPSNGLTNGFLKRLSAATSNDPDAGPVADIYRQRVVTTLHGAIRFAAGLAIAKTFDVHEPTSYPYTAQLNGTLTTVRDHRTGNSCRLTTEVDTSALSRLKATVTMEGAEPIDVALDDVPEGFKSAITHKLNLTLSRRCLTPAERDDVLTGTPFVSVVKRALVRTMSALREGVTDRRLAGAADLLDLCALNHISVPFDAQTIASTLVENDPNQEDERLAALMRRMNLALS